MNNELLEILVCPICKGKLEYQPDKKRLLCRAERLAYPIDDGVPLLLADLAEPLTDEESDHSSLKRR